MSHFIEDAFKFSTDIETSHSLSEVIVLLLKNAISSSREDVGLRLASYFDLIVSAEYYKKIGHTKWFYCPEGQQGAFVHYTNTCPRCVLKKSKFYYHSSSKPESGQIGQVTGTILCKMLATYFDLNNTPIKVKRGKEPIDVLFFEEATNTLLLAEIKAAPLVVLPLFVKTDRMITHSESKGVSDLNHKNIEITNLGKESLYITLPCPDGEIEFIEFAKQIDFENSEWPVLALKELVKNNQVFLEKYFQFWKTAFNAYSSSKKEEPIFWLTGACGQPNPRPEIWPKRKTGGGFESVSDQKTSVGMDRTDDIKKGIYQVLKIGAESKPNKYGNWCIKTGLISNIHAVRHYDEYLKTLGDIVWTNDRSGKALAVSDLPPETPLYNLFDGIISFSTSRVRDRWIKEKFTFIQK